MTRLLAPLPASDEELSRIAGAHPGSRLIVGQFRASGWGSQLLYALDAARITVGLVEYDCQVPGLYAPSPPLLSLLICSVPNRAAQRDRLVEWLSMQTATWSRGCVVLDVDELPSRTIGEKRQRMLEKASGRYVAFIDDDDRVALDYLERIRRALESGDELNPDGVDCVGFRGTYTTDGKDPEPFEHSIRHKQWETRNGLHLRSPNHLNPVRRQLALAAGFPASSHGEDHEYSKRLLPMLHTEVFLDGAPVYYYWYRTKKAHGA